MGGVRGLKNVFVDLVAQFGGEGEEGACLLDGDW